MLLKSPNGRKWIQGLRGDGHGREEVIQDSPALRQVRARLQAFRKESKSLPPCPLVLPLRDGQGRITPLGSYMSYLGMKGAAYLPEAVLRIPNVGEVFNNLDLFQDGPLPLHEVADRQLPFRFQAKDVVEGTLVEDPSGATLSLRCRGSFPERQFSTRLGKGHLHEGPSWIAARVHEWLNLKPTQAQAAFLATPIFTSEVDFRLGARTERLIRRAPFLVNGWEGVLGRHPDSALLYDRWLAINNHRGCPVAPIELENRFRNAPQDELLRLDYRGSLLSQKKYVEAFRLVLEDLGKDDDNVLHYNMGTQVLEGMNAFAESVELAKIWCEKHPENQEAWMALGDAYHAWAWQARGNGFASSVTDEGWRLMKERMTLAENAMVRATEVAPGDCRTWSRQLGLGTGCSYPRRKMEALFQRVVELNPYYLDAYYNYLNYLQPKWFGKHGEALAFADRYAERHPFLTYEAVSEDFWMHGDFHSEEEQLALVDGTRERALKSPHFPKMKLRMEEALKSYPHFRHYWEEYLFWMVRVGRREDALAFAKQVLTGAPEELKSLYPRLALNALMYEERNQVTSRAKEAWRARPDVVNPREVALSALMEADASDWGAWNMLAQHQVRQGQLAQAKKSFEHIGIHWAPGIWKKAEFDQAKALAQKAAKS